MIDRSSKNHIPEIVVVGAGAAGTYTAIVAAELGARVTLVSPTPLAASASYWAQGGMAAALDSNDSLESHIKDTLKAGRDACSKPAVETLCEEAPECVEELQRLGVSFDTDLNGRLSLSLEGGHSHRRIVHAGGSETGRHLINTLSSIASRHRLIDTVEGRGVSDLLTGDDRCLGVVLDTGAEIRAAGVVLATGGGAALWGRTTNPSSSLGSGLRLAYRAGATLTDLEFVQFHPTAVASSGSVNGFLVTEAVRGEGAKLLDSNGQQFVDELAPRDLVAQAIYRQMQSNNSKHVFLDMRDVSSQLFPNVVERLQLAGIDASKDLVPVAPAAHYMMGGIAVDLDGHSTLKGLFAVGECACTGVHGANRLASNSLSECFVFGRRAAKAAVSTLLPLTTESVAHSFETIDTTPSSSTSNELWQHVGLSRSAEGLKDAQKSPHLLTRLIAESAEVRKESRGCHLRVDFPENDESLAQLRTAVRVGTDVQLLERTALQKSSFT